jgi:Mn2+/Fe2+ NRAMP family transporter
MILIIQMEGCNIVVDSGYDYGQDNRNARTVLVVWNISLFFILFFLVAHSLIATTIAVYAGAPLSRVLQRSVCVVSRALGYFGLLSY